MPLPDAPALERALAILKVAAAESIRAPTRTCRSSPARSSASRSSALESLVKMRDHAGQALGAADLTRIKKDLVERDSAGLVEFIESQRTLDDYHGQEALKQWLRQDIALWQAGDLKALPMGYLLCGPVGTGKTFLVECLAGEAGVPVVKLKNFRDRWVGSSEGNLEKIFRLVRALGRCMVFIDEADQSARPARLRQRRQRAVGPAVFDDRAGDGGHRESRPRAVDAGVVATGSDRSRSEAPRSRRREGAAAADQHAGRERGAHRGAREALRTRARPTRISQTLTPRMPTLLTPGAAEALVVKAYRRSRTENVSADAALEACLVGYQNPVPADVLEFQMRIAIREATDLAFVPPAFQQVRRAARSAAPHERPTLLPRCSVQRASPRHADAAELVRRRGVRAARRVRESRRSG